MKGYKAFNKDLSCRGYQFELDNINIFEGEPVLCFSGFHFCTELEDVLKYYCYSDMRVFEIEANGIITKTEDGCSKRACSEIKLIKEIPLYEVAQYVTTSKLVYRWARDIGNQDIMIDKITDSEYAYKWALNIGNRDIMINKIDDQLYAYYWGLYIGNRDIMINKINDSEYAYWWARNIGNQDIMIDKITDSEYAYEWAKCIGNKQYFIDRGLIK